MPLRQTQDHGFEGMDTHGTGWLARVGFDRGYRHLLMARVIQSLATEGSAVLDVGGSGGIVSRLLPEHRVVSVDPSGEGVDLVASGTQLPFADSCFDVVVGLDVLEHVPPGDRMAFIDEATRVGGAVVIAGPFSDLHVEESETFLRAFADDLFLDHGDWWLDEHDANGLPELEATAGQLQDSGLAVGSLGSAPVQLWQALVVHELVSIRLGEDPYDAELADLLDVPLLESLDAVGPSYRRFVMAAGPKALDVASGLVRGATDAALATAVGEVERATARALDRAVRRSDDVKQSLQVGLDKATAGWRESVDRVTELEEQLQAGEPDRESS